MASSKYLHYLEEMEHYDKDNRYMGANDLWNLICSEGSTFDTEKEKKWIAAFIKQLDDNSTEVQGKAVQCLAKIASKIREDNLGNILKKVADCIVSGEKDFRDIYLKILSPFPLNDLDQFNFDRDWTKGIYVLGILINLLIFIIKLEFFS